MRKHLTTIFVFEVQNFIDVQPMHWSQTIIIMCSLRNYASVAAKDQWGQGTNGFRLLSETPCPSEHNPNYRNIDRARQSAMMTSRCS